MRKTTETSYIKDPRAALAVGLPCNDMHPLIFRDLLLWAMYGKIDRSLLKRRILPGCGVFRCASCPLERTTLQSKPAPRGTPSILTLSCDQLTVTGPCLFVCIEQCS